MLKNLFMGSLLARRTRILNVFKAMLAELQSAQEQLEAEAERIEEEVNALRAKRLEYQVEAERCSNSAKKIKDILG